MMPKTTLFSRSAKLPAMVAAVALLGTTAYTLPSLVDVPAKAATDLTKTLHVFYGLSDSYTRLDDIQVFSSNFKRLISL